MEHKREQIFDYILILQKGGKITNDMSAAFKKRLRMTGGEVKGLLLAGLTPNKIMQDYYRPHPNDKVPDKPLDAQRTILAMLKHNEQKLDAILRLLNANKADSNIAGFIESTLFNHRRV